MNDDTKAILLIADISGYTRFMKLHAISISHAQQIIVRLLKAIMNASKSPLKVAELEGDAVFFYALCSNQELQKIAEQIKGQLLRMFATFKKELAVLTQMNVCSCAACIQVGDLKLKQVLHIGEVAVEKIARFEKLFGLDVIVVHRMLKNSVPAREYVMMTNAAYHSLVDFYGLAPERYTEEFEGVGSVDTLVFYPSQLPEVIAEHQTELVRLTVADKLAWISQIVPRTFMDLLGLRKIKAAFHNLPA